MWQKKEFDRTFAGDDESPKAKNAGTVAEIFQHIPEFGEFRKVIKALEAPIRTDDAEILLFLQAAGREGASVTWRRWSRRKQLYREFVSMGDREQILQAFSRKKWPWVLGSEGFVSAVKERFFARKLVERISRIVAKSQKQT
jgi:hypothetical protein